MKRTAREWTPEELDGWELRKDGAADPLIEARASFPALLDALLDRVAD